VGRKEDYFLLFPILGLEVILSIMFIERFFVQVGKKA